MTKPENILIAYLRPRRGFIISALTIIGMLWLGYTLINFVQNYLQRTGIVMKSHNELWYGAVIVKVCPGGVRIYRLKNGELRSGHDPVESKDVC